ncbi:MAG: hypothetical protein AAFW66_10060, partial [Pseudomonadota bacterium]
MSNFEKLVDAISTEDAATRVVARRREILEALNEYISDGGSDKVASFLWLVDWNEQKGQATCTLWSQAGQNWPDFPDASKFMSIIECSKLQPDSTEFEKTINGIEARAKSLLKLESDGSDERGVISPTTIKLCQRGESERLERLVGFVQIFSGDDQSRRLVGTNKRIIAKLLSNRIVFGRRQRVHDAIKHLQSNIRDGMSELEIVEKVALTLNKYVTADECCFYTHQSAEGPRREDSVGNMSAVHPILTPAVTNFLKANKDWPRRPRVFRVHDCLNPDPSNPLSDYLPTDKLSTEGFPLDLMLVSVPVEEDSEAPFVTIKLAVRPSENFIGGRFSETDESIAATLSDYLRHLLPGVITQRRAKVITRKLDGIEAPELLSKQNDLSSFWPFPSLITEILPSIESAWAVREHLDKATKSRISHWIDQDKVTSRDKYLIPDEDEAIIIKFGEDRAIHWEPVLSAADEKYWLCWRTNRKALSEHDQIAIKLIASEMRLRAIGRLDVHELLQQTNELRHAIRSSMTG